jgi:hypothetical protein
VRDVAILFLHLLATVARLAGPGGARSVVAESVLVKHQLLILNRSRKRSPNLRPSDRLVASLCAVFIRPGRLIRSAIVFKPSKQTFRGVTRRPRAGLGKQSQSKRSASIRTSENAQLVTQGENLEEDV